jgi:mRNA interferase MazF
MQQKKIVLTRFPFTDLTSVKRRPAIVLSRRKSHSADVIVAFISSVVPSMPDSSDFVLETSHPDFARTGLKETSVFKWINWQPWIRVFSSDKSEKSLM